MIVTPTPDLVLDVLQAADPLAKSAATAKLNAAKPLDADFGATLDGQVGHAAASANAADGLSSAMIGQAEVGLSAAANAAAPMRAIKGPSSADTYRKFEAFVLQVFVETMLPQKADDVFGKGTAGNIWRSMLAEQLGNQLAQGKGLGIAKQLAAAHPAQQDGSGKGG